MAMAVSTVDAVWAQEEVVESKWRKTKYGWLDSSRWQRPEPAGIERRIELIHPLLYSAFLLVSSTGLLIWASEGDDWPQKRKRTVEKQ